MHIVITGASSGIGRELAKQLSRQGHCLSLCGRQADKLADSLNLLAEGGSYYHHAFCVTDTQAMNNFVDAAVLALGPIDVLINCAGLNSARAQGHELALSELEWMMQVNCYAPIALMQKVIPLMQARQSGSIINVLSTTCLFANKGIAGYTASKAALDAYVKVMRKELHGGGIKMLSVYPGGVDTDFREASRPQYLSAAAVASAVANLLLSDANTHVHELVIRPECEENYV